METIPFFKVQGTGNDFVLIDNRELNLSDQTITSLAPDLCNRRFGIGADGVLGLQPPEDSSLDYTMLYCNADGSDAGMCGNGARCLALFAEQSGLGDNLRFSVHQDVYQAKVKPDDQYVRVKFPMQVEIRQIYFPDEPILYQVNTGTEHIVQNVSDKQFDQVELLAHKGKTLRNHVQFKPKGTNVNFVYGDDADNIKVRTYERGVEALTMACGTGAIASGITWHSQNKRDAGEHQITVKTDGGLLNVGFNYDTDEETYSDIELGGEAHIVFEGEYRS